MKYVHITIMAGFFVFWLQSNVLPLVLPPKYDKNMWKQESSIHCFVFWCYELITNINFVHLITKLITKICLYNFRAVSKEEYPYKIYPPYCQGALYLFDIHTSEQLCHLFEMELHRNYVWIEDVFITGYLFTYVFFLFI